MIIKNIESGNSLYLCCTKEFTLNIKKQKINRYDQSYSRGFY